MAVKEEFWPGWQTVRAIGKGGFGAVYEIQRDVMGDTERAALKVLRIPKDSGVIEEMRDAGMDDDSITLRLGEYLRDVVREYKLMAKLRGHPNVVYCDDIRYTKHADGLGWDVFIKMELLDPIVKLPQSHFTQEEIIRLGTDICNALITCDERSIVHRDVKPQNIFLSRGGNYKLGDFGISKTMESTTGATMAGSYPFMAPEVNRMERYRTGADIYSLGMVLYWLLNQRRGPFLPLPPQVPTASGEADAIKRRFSGEQIPPPAQGSEALKQVVLKACAFAPEQRYRTAAQMRQDLLCLDTAAEDRRESDTVCDSCPTVIETGQTTVKAPPQPEHSPVPAPRREPAGKRKGRIRRFLLAGILTAAAAGGLMLLSGANSVPQEPPEQYTQTGPAIRSLQNDRGQVTRVAYYTPAGDLVGWYESEFGLSGTESRRTIRSPLGEELAVLEFRADGRLYQAAYPVTEWTWYAFDAHNRLLEEISYINQVQIQWSGIYRYDGNGSLQTHSYKNSSGNQTVTNYTYEYDHLNRISRRYHYDERKILSLWEELEYDSDGRESRVYAYDGNGMVIHWTESTWDPSGQMCIQKTYDPNGALMHQEERYFAREDLPGLSIRRRADGTVSDMVIYSYFSHDGGTAALGIAMNQ